MDSEILSHLRTNSVVAMPTDTVWGLLANAKSQQAVDRLYALKGRNQAQPCQLLVASLKMAAQMAEFSPQALSLAQAFWPGALTLILPVKITAHFSPSILGNQSETVGLRIPNSPDIIKIIEMLKSPLAASSVNITGQPVCQTRSEILDNFPELPIFGDEPAMATASTIVKCYHNRIEILREGVIASSQINEVAYGSA